MEMIHSLTPIVMVGGKEKTSWKKKDCEKKKFDKEKVGNSSTIVCKVVSLEVSIYRILQALRRILRI